MFTFAHICFTGVIVPIKIVPKCVYNFLIVPVLPDVVSVADESELSSRCIMLLPDRLIGKRDVEPKTPN